LILLAFKWFPNPVQAAYMLVHRNQPKGR